MKKGWQIMLLALLSLAITSCARAETTPDSAPSEAVYVDGGTLVVTLEGNPTTGYEWTLESELSCLSGGECEYSQNPASELALGTGGVYTFRFEPAATGKQTLRFVYARAWSPDSAMDEYELTVAVAETATGYDITWE